MLQRSLLNVLPGPAVHLQVPHVLEEVCLLLLHAGEPPQVLQPAELARPEDELEQRDEGTVGGVLAVPQPQLDRPHQELLHHEVELLLALAACYSPELLKVVIQGIRNLRYFLNVYLNCSVFNL